jgi:hypothetical protein
MRWTIAICALLGFAAMQDAGPQVHKQGTIRIFGTFAIDLDDGRVGVSDSDAAVEKTGQTPVLIIDGASESPVPFHGSFKGSDFWFENAGQRYLRPQHGAQFSKGIFQTAGQAACLAATYTRDAIRIDKLSSNEYICLRTNEGRLASIVISSYDLKTTQLTINYTTWEKSTR